MARAFRHHRQLFQHLGHLAPGQDEIAVATLAAADQQAPRLQPGKVGTGRLGGDPGLSGQFSGGQRLAAHQ